MPELKVNQSVIVECQSGIANDINQLVDVFHLANKEAGWWDKTKDQKIAEESLKEDGHLMSTDTQLLLKRIVDKERCPYTMQVLIISEVIEAMEGVRKNLMDDKLPEHSMEGVEMADVFLRLLDYCGGRGIDLGKLVTKKAIFNMTRKDHTKEARSGKNGKQV